MGKIADWKLEGLFKADPDKVTEEIESIGYGATTQQIYEKAKDENTELHKCVTWDDREAAEKWRLHEIRLVCTMLVIHREDKEETPIRYFLRQEGEKEYKPTVKIVQNMSEYQKMLQQAYAELSAFKRKYASLSELDYILRLI